MSLPKVALVFLGFIWKMGWGCLLDTKMYKNKVQDKEVWEQTKMSKVLFLRDKFIVLPLQVVPPWGRHTEGSTHALFCSICFQDSSWYWAGPMAASLALFQSIVLFPPCSMWPSFHRAGFTFASHFRFSYFTLDLLLRFSFQELTWKVERDRISSFGILLILLRVRIP